MAIAPIVMRLVSLAKNDPLKLKALIARSPKWSKRFNVDYAGRRAARTKQATTKAEKMKKDTYDYWMKHEFPEKNPHGYGLAGGKAQKPLSPSQLKLRARTKSRKVYDRILKEESADPRLFWDDLAEGWAGKKPSRVATGTQKALNRTARYGKTGLIGLGAGSLLGLGGGGGGGQAPLSDEELQQIYMQAYDQAKMEMDMMQGLGESPELERQPHVQTQMHAGMQERLNPWEGIR